MNRKLKKILLITLVIVIFVFPLNINSKYEAVLWGLERDEIILEEDIGGIFGHIKHYPLYKLRILIFTFEIEDESNISYAQR